MAVFVLSVKLFVLSVKEILYVRAFKTNDVSFLELFKSTLAKQSVVVGICIQFVVSLSEKKIKNKTKHYYIITKHYHGTLLRNGTVYKQSLAFPTQGKLVLSNFDTQGNKKEEKEMTNIYHTPVRKILQQILFCFVPTSGLRIDRRGFYGYKFGRCPFSDK